MECKELTPSTDNSFISDGTIWWIERLSTQFNAKILPMNRTLHYMYGQHIIMFLIIWTCHVYYRGNISSRFSKKSWRIVSSLLVELVSLLYNDSLTYLLVIKIRQISIFQSLIINEANNQSILKRHQSICTYKLVYYSLYLGEMKTAKNLQPHYIVLAVVKLHNHPTPDSSIQ